MAVIERINHGPVSGIRVGRFNKGINTTFVVYQYQDVLIDTGPINQWQYINKFVDEKDLNHVLITHHHEDHSGNAYHLLKQKKLSVLTNNLCQQLLKQTYSIPFIQKLIWGTAKAVSAQLLPANFISDQGLNLDIILTPGHTEDMSCFHDKENGFLFTGDLYIASKVRYYHKDEDLEKQIQSLNKVLTLDFDTAFCPHRGIMKNGKKDITNKRDFILELSSTVKSLAKSGLPVKEIRKQLLGKEDMFTLMSKFHFTKQGLIDACLALPENP
ncbi:MAG: MBL fold metallo-hydrolase [Colwellia sp.]|nr:MBL fold metallo-hydrolase [Colwellia sp.]